MMSNTELNRLVQELFNKRYAVVVAPIYEEMTLPDVQVAPIESLNMCDGHIVEYDNSHENFIAQYLHSTIDYTGDEAEDEARAYTPVERSLPATTIASILAMDGQLRLVNPPDVTLINASVGQYLTQVNLRKATEVNYTPPPDDDLRALENMLTLIKPAVEMIRLHGKGLADWDQVMSSLMFGGAVKRIGRIEEDAIESRAQAAKAELEPPKPVDPYKF